LDPKTIIESKVFVRKTRKLFHQHDPIGLKPCPEDEYEPERASVCRRLAKCNGLKQVESMVHKEFVHWFGGRLAGPPERYSKLSQDLLALYKTFHKSKKK
jgi:hypothetical protein